MSGQESMVGFAVSAVPEKERVMVYGMKKGLVVCPMSSFQEGLWEEGALAQWYSLEVVPEESLLGSYRALSVKKLPCDKPPIDVSRSHISNLYMMWKSGTRIVVGTVHERFGIGWSPDVGRVFIPGKFFKDDNIRPLQELHVEIHLNSQKSLEMNRQEHWVVFRIDSDSGDEKRVAESPEVRMFHKTKVVRIGDSRGELMEVTDEGRYRENRISFLNSDVKGTNGSGNLRSVLSPRSEWSVLAHADTSAKGEGALWKAIALLPLNTHTSSHESSERTSGVIRSEARSRSSSGVSSSSPPPILSSTDGSQLRPAAEEMDGTGTKDGASQTEETQESRRRHSQEVDLMRKRVSLLEEEMGRIRVECHHSNVEKRDLEEQLAALQEASEANSQQQGGSLDEFQSKKLILKYKREAVEARNELGRLRETRPDPGQNDRDSPGARNLLISLQAANQQLEAEVEALKEAQSVEKKEVETGEAGSQAEGEEERDLIQKIYRDREVFSFICQKSPDLVRDFFNVIHTLKLSLDK